MAPISVPRVIAGAGVASLRRRFRSVRMLYSHRWNTPAVSGEPKSYTRINMHSKTGILMVGGLLLVIVLSSAPTQKTHLPETTHLIDSIQGPALYTAYCAVCHGRDGKGAGPMAKSLRVAPPDLARIAMRNGGRFPMARI